MSRAATEIRIAFNSRHFRITKSVRERFEKQSRPTSEVNDATLNVGFRLGHYEVTAQIDQGGMGEMYRARSDT